MLKFLSQINTDVISDGSVILKYSLKYPWDLPASHTYKKIYFYS